MQNHKSSARLLQILLDQVFVTLMLILHAYLKNGRFDSPYPELAVCVVLLMALIYSGMGLYTRQKSILGYMWALSKSWVLVLMALIMIGFLTKTSERFSREVILTWAVTGFLVQVMTYRIIHFIQSRIVKEEILSIVIGGGELGKHLVNHINGNSWVPDKIVGVIESNQQLSDDWEESTGVSILGTLDTLENVIQSMDIRRLYIALPMQQAELIKPIYLKLVDQNVDIIWAPDIFGVNLLNHSVREIAGVPLICLSETPLIGSNAFAKSMFDRGVAATAILVLSPVLLSAALAISLTSRGPVLFKQKRHGFDGAIFNVWKFRSMKVHEEADGNVTQATKNDKRLTVIGSFLRKSSVDELPQLFNVLAGSMSLVGPRPHALAHNKQYSSKIEAYMTRHRIKPGLTGLAQVNGYRGRTDTLEKMATRVQYDLAYINNWSIWLDIQIIIRTVFVLFSKNAF